MPQLWERESWIGSLIGGAPIPVDVQDCLMTVAVRNGDIALLEMLAAAEGLTPENSAMLADYPEQEVRVRWLWSQYRTADELDAWAEARDGDIGEEEQWRLLMSPVAPPRFVQRSLTNGDPSTLHTIMTNDALGWPVRLPAFLMLTQTRQHRSALSYAASHPHDDLRRVLLAVYDYVGPGESSASSWSGDDRSHRKQIERWLYHPDPPASIRNQFRSMIMSMVASGVGLRVMVDHWDVCAEPVQELAARDSLVEVYGELLDADGQLSARLRDTVTQVSDTATLPDASAVMKAALDSPGFLTWAPRMFLMRALIGRDDVTFRSAVRAFTALEHADHETTSHLMRNVVLAALSTGSMGATQTLAAVAVAPPAGTEILAARAVLGQFDAGWGAAVGEQLAELMVRDDKSLRPGFFLENWGIDDRKLAALLSIPSVLETVAGLVPAADLVVLGHLLPRSQRIVTRFLFDAVGADEARWEVLRAGFSTSEHDVVSMMEAVDAVLR